MIVKAPAKVNLCLNILGRRADGYHELETIMQTVDLYDILRIEANQGGGLDFRCSDLSLEKDNLVAKAADIFYAALGRPPQATIRLEKNIPHGAGLGGGSSDAAATLWGLNRLYEKPFNHKQLEEMSLALGADVPFFLTRGTALCTGIGQHVTPWPWFPLGHYLLVKPPRALSTAQVYAATDIKTLQTREPLSTIAQLRFNQFDLKPILNNDLEKAALAMCPELADIREKLYVYGAYGVLMSGSGSTMFGLFSDAGKSARAATLLTAQQTDNWWITACQGTNMDF